MRANKYSTRRVRVKLPIEIKTQDAEIYFDIEDVEVIHSPERPMPNCQNPDSPAFYDTGDPEENEISDIKDIEFQIRERFNEIIESLKVQLELVIDSIDEIDIHQLLVKGCEDE